MKNVLLIFCAAALLVFYSCNKGEEKKPSGVTTISMDDASAWIDAYMNGKGGGEKFSPFISKENWDAMQKDAPANSEGVFIMPGTDKEGKNHWLSWFKTPDPTGKTPQTWEPRAYVSPYDTVCRCKPCCFPPSPTGDSTKVLPDTLSH